MSEAHRRYRVAVLTVSKSHRSFAGYCFLASVSFNLAWARS
jgi:hypothetical protein